MTAALLEARDVGFHYRRGPAVLDGVSLPIAPGEAVGLVGESGAGKTSLLRLLLGLATPTSGDILFRGKLLDTRDRRVMRDFRRTVQPIFQDPFSSLDPRVTVGDTIAEPLRSLGVHGDRAARTARVSELLRAVDLPADAATRYPESFSGGQRQRIAIARALAPDPAVLLADEPVSALDTSVRMLVIDLVREIARERGIGMLLVSHDLTVVSALCERTTVLEGGRIVEEGPTGRLLAAPQHPYTQRLLASVPRLPRP